MEHVIALLTPPLVVCAPASSSQKSPDTTKYSVSIVWVPHFVPPPPLTAASPVLQSEPRISDWTPRPISGDQKPSPNGLNWHLPPKSADHLYSQTRSRDEAVRSDHSEQLTVFPWHGDLHRTSTLPLMWLASLLVASQNFAYASLWYPRILPTSRWELPSANKMTIRCSICSGKFCGMMPFKG